MDFQDPDALVFGNTPVLVLFKVRWIEMNDLVFRNWSRGLSAKVICIQMLVIYHVRRWNDELSWLDARSTTTSGPKINKFSLKLLKHCKVTLLEWEW
jgi:hypothetical protein